MWRNIIRVLKDKTVGIAKENIRAFLGGEELKTKVDIKAGYRKFTG